MAQTATKREQRRQSPPPGSYWHNGLRLYYIMYSRPEDDAIWIEDCFTCKTMEMRRFDWHRCGMREVKR